MAADHLSPWSLTLRKALALAEAHPEEALALLDAGIQDAREASQAEQVSRFARHAGVICDHLGDLDRTLGYYDQALRGDPDDELLHLARAGILERAGQHSEAEAAFAEAERLARLKADLDVASAAAAGRDRVRSGPRGK
jgi:tetratricopeptide (TPR) repeat protein